ncbi:MAG: hypothetical protein MO853_10340 [Candidatus Protistobacter heckmanni]|nr:hypothetical protein [Candidatus Protistobacter heckmanni]
MSEDVTIKYFGWSSISIETAQGALFLDPFYRPYCGAKWFKAKDFAHAKYICVTHGHEEHFLDVPLVAKSTGATLIGAPSVCGFLKRRSKIGEAQLRAIDPAKFETVSVPGFKLTALPWKHCDIKLYKALTKAVFQGNATQLSWAWSSATNAPFYSPYTGFHVELPNGLTVLNYNEGFNRKMTDEEVALLGRKFKTDILLAGMQLNFIEDMVRGGGGDPAQGGHPLSAAREIPRDDGRELRAMDGLHRCDEGEVSRDRGADRGVWLCLPGLGADGFHRRLSVFRAGADARFPVRPRLAIFAHACRFAGLRASRRPRVPAWPCQAVIMRRSAAPGVAFSAGPERGPEPAPCAVSQRLPCRPRRT